MTSATSFFIVTRFDTNTDRVAPFGPVKGFLLDKEGNPLRAVTIDAFTGTNSFLFGAQLHPNLGFFDFYGVHLDFTAPDLPAASITNSFFRIGTHNGFYAIGLLPDAGSTMLLAAISLGLVFSLGAGKARRPLGPE